MGGDKSTQQSSTQVQQTPEEKQFNQLRLSQAQEFDPIQRQLDSNAGSLVNNLLLGQNLPGYLNTLPGGISPDVTNSIVQQSLQDIAPQFQKSGILDSGTAAQISARTSADIRNQSAQFNLQNLMQLLNLGVGGQAQVQQPIQQNNAALGQSLAGLRSTNTSGSTIGMNPFLKSLQTGLGQAPGQILSRMGQGTGMYGGGGL